MFKMGDRVIKSARFSKENYCYYDGDEADVPLGTEGEVKKVESPAKIRVLFDNGVEWDLHSKELTIKGGSKMETLKNYFKKNSETFITLGIIILVDEYIFGGALREKVKSLLEKLLGQTTKKLTGDN